MIGPPDITFAIQIVSFIILWFGLKRLLFDPVLQVLEERRARTVGVRDQAAALRVEVDETAASYDQRLTEVRNEIGRESDAARNATDDEERRVLAAAREQAAAQLREQREQIRAQADAARTELSRESGELATLIVQRVMGGGRA